MRTAHVGNQKYCFHTQNLLSYPYFRKLRARKIYLVNYEYKIHRTLTFWSYKGTQMSMSSRVINWSEKWKTSKQQSWEIIGYNIVNESLESLKLISKNITIKWVSQKTINFISIPQNCLIKETLFLIQSSPFTTDTVGTSNLCPL